MHYEANNERKRGSVDWHIAGDTQNSSVLDPNSVQEELLATQLLTSPF